MLRFALLVSAHLALTVAAPQRAAAQAVRVGVAADHPVQPACTLDALGKVQPHRPWPGQELRGEASCGERGRVVWPGGPGRILVAEDEGWTNGTHCVPQVDGRVVRVDCASGAEEVVVVRPGADFGNAALSPWAGSLYFTGAAGVERLDVRTLKVAGVTRRPERMCADALDEGAREGPGAGRRGGVPAALGTTSHPARPCLSWHRLLEAAGGTGSRWISTFKGLGRWRSRLRPSRASLAPRTALCGRPGGATAT
ncbi:MAG: hypothetical protein R3F43_15305 [bacterium]